MTHFEMKVIKTHPRFPARVTRICTAHGEFLTPCFMPVATRAYLNLMTPAQLKEIGAQIILGGNTYHMLVAPGMEVIESAGGMHRFMDWELPMLTDSGGFQVFSLAQGGQCQIDEEGAHFKHPVTHGTVHLTPESSLATQKIIGADIIMAFDECTPDTDDKARVESALEKTSRWLIQSKEYHTRHPCSAYGYRQALFGIVQGAGFRDLRERSAEHVVAQGVDGIAIGGESIGFNMQKTVEILNWLQPFLPLDKPRYTMGLGMNPQDLCEAAYFGIDLFDCVAPTRNARHGALYCGKIIKENDWVSFKSDEPRCRINIKKSCYAKDEQPIMPGCDCYTCEHFSRAYLHYLFRTEAVFYSNLACLHNVRVMTKISEAMRECILAA